MRLFLLTALTMTAFAANSVLNRAGVDLAGTDAVWFGTVRLWSGALVLAGLVLALRGGLRLTGPGRLAGVLGLVLYIYGFSLAYVRLESGLGALILFGTVQVTMFAGSLWQGERPPMQRWAGAGLAFGGLAWLLWPDQAAGVSLSHGLAMVVAGIGWGAYSLAGRRATDPLAATAANFLLAAPVGLLLTLGLPDIGSAQITGTGLALAVVSGAVTSGLGYALWYGVLPRLAGTVAAVAQLTVPLIAMVGGLVFLAERPGPDFIIAAIVVLGGIGLSLLRRSSG